MKIYTKTNQQANKELICFWNTAGGEQWEKTKIIDYVPSVFFNINKPDYFIVFIELIDRIAIYYETNYYITNYEHNINRGAIAAHKPKQQGVCLSPLVVFFSSNMK